MSKSKAVINDSEGEVQEGETEIKKVKQGYCNAKSGLIMFDLVAITVTVSIRIKVIEFKHQKMKDIMFKLTNEQLKRYKEELSLRYDYICLQSNFNSRRQREYCYFIYELNAFLISLNCCKFHFPNCCCIVYIHFSSTKATITFISTSWQRCPIPLV